jgi:hypothetical protein
VAGGGATYYCPSSMAPLASGVAGILAYGRHRQHTAPSCTGVLVPAPDSVAINGLIGINSTVRLTLGILSAVVYDAPLNPSVL